MHRDLSFKKFLVAAVLALLVLLGGCSAGATQSDSHPANVPEDAGQQYPEEAGEYPAEDGEDTDAPEQMVIRTKTLRFEVESTPEAVTRIREMTLAASGTVSEMRVASDDGWVHRDDGNGEAMRGWVTVRVPTDGYEAFLDEVMGLGELEYQSEASEDVTQEHVDLTARLENLRAQEQRLREFFDAAANVEEMLAIEQELGRVRGEIESLDARITHLERRAAMATVTLELTEPRPVVAPQGPSWGFVEAVTDGFRGAAELVTGVLTVLIATSPLWVAGLVLFFPIRALVRKRRAREAAAGVGAKQSILDTVAAPARPEPTASPTPSSGPTPPPAD